MPGTVCGPEDVTGNRIIEPFEQIAGYKVENVEFKAMGWLDDLVADGVFPESVLPSTMAGFEPSWDERCLLEETLTSTELQTLAPLRRTIDDACNAILEASGCCRASS